MLPMVHCTLLGCSTEVCTFLLFHVVEYVCNICCVVAFLLKTCCLFFKTPYHMQACCVNAAVAVMLQIVPEFVHNVAVYICKVVTYH